MDEQTKSWRIVAVRRLSEAQLEALSEVAEVDYFEDVDESNRADFMAALSRAHGLIGGKLELNEAMLARRLRFKWYPPFQWAMTTCPLRH